MEHPVPSLQRDLSTAVAELSRCIGQPGQPAARADLDRTMARLCLAVGADLALYAELSVDGRATISHRWQAPASPPLPDRWSRGQGLDLRRLADHLARQDEAGPQLLHLDGRRPDQDLAPAGMLGDGFDWLLLTPSGPHGRLRGALLWLASGDPPPLSATNLELLSALGVLLAETLLRQDGGHTNTEEELRWRTLAEAAFEAILVHRNGHIVDANSEACVLFGRPRDELIGRRAPGDLVLPDQVAEIEQRIRSHSTDRHEVRILRPDGTVVPAESRAREFVVGGVTQRVVALRDISEDKRQRQLLVESYQRLYTLLEATFEGILVHRRGEVIESNQGFADMCGYTLDEVIGMVPSDVTTPESARIVAEKIRSRDHAPYVVTGLRKDGSTFPMEIQGVECVYKGEQVRITGFRDLTAEHAERDRQRQLEERMQAAQRLESLGMLASGVAHDFNNLLVSILGNAELAELAISGPPSALTALQRIQTAAVKASELTRQLQAYAGRRTPEPAPLALAALVSETADLIRSTLTPGIHLDLDLPASLPRVMGDAAQISQVLLNLLTNAAEALHGGSESIEVSLRSVRIDGVSDARLPGPPPQPGTYVALTVRDDGCGMDQDTRQRMFEPFFSTHFAGRGLGLAAVLGIVRGHGGGLLVRSAPGVGTEVQVLLPVAEDQTIPPPPPELVERPRPDLILLIDDEPEILMVAQAMLEAARHSVLTASSGEEGIETWLRHRDRIALVMLDLAMPDMRGEAVRAALVERDPDVKVVFCSGFEASPEIEALVALGNTHFLMKPYRMKDLLQVVSGALSRA